MKTSVPALLALGTIFALASCTKDPTETSVTSSPVSRTQTSSMIIGNWNLLEERDTTISLTGIKASSWSLENWVYNFDTDGILRIEHDGFTDLFTYEFVDNNYINIGWTGTPNVIATDTIVSLTKSELVFKHWKNNEDQSKTKKVYYFAK